MEIRPAFRNASRAGSFLVLGAVLLSLGRAMAGIVTADFHSATDVPVSTGGNFVATGYTVNLTLYFAPPVGTNLTVVNITSPASQVSGTFTNLAQGQAVTLSYGGQDYDFVANYNGGTGNDLVLQWANTRPMAWGNNGNGQLGNGGTTTSNAPVEVTTSGALAGKTIVALSAGRNHSVALCSDGTVAAWGLNSNGQIGSNGGSQSAVPVIVSSLGVLATKRVIAVAAGETHNLALCSDGTVAAWGSYGNGQLGNGGTATTGTPVSVNTSGVLSGKKVVAIAAGQLHGVALLSNGTVAAWGNNFYGQLGNGGSSSSTVPVLVNTTGVLAGKTVTAIAAGQRHCLALCSDGTLASWGANSDGQLGDGGTTTSNVPVPVTTAGTFLAGRTVIAVAAGAFHSLALCSDGKIAAWGLNAYGQLGRSSGSNLLAGGVNTSGALLGKTVTSVAGGLSHSLAQCSDGALTAWGDSFYGQMGTGLFTSSPVPQNVSAAPLFAGQRFATAFSGPNAFHSLAIVASPPLPGQFTTGTLISNGSFESGFSNWSVSDINQPFKSLLVRGNGYPPGFGLFSTTATNGNFSASSGFEGFGPGIVRLAHDVPVTAAEPFVRFDYRAGWDMLTYNGSTQPRTFSLTIEPVGGGPVLQKSVVLTAAPHTKTLDTGPLTSSVDLSAYAGTTVRVCFDLTVPEINTGPAFFQLDNVRTAALLPASVNPITGPAADLAIHDATLNGIVNTNGLNATVEFEYGLTPSYGSVATATPSPVACVTDTAVSAVLSGLNLNTTYHYRIKTITSEGVKVGVDATFTTLPHAPAVNGLSADYGVTSARLSADVNPDGASTVVTFEYGLTPAYGSSTPAWENPITTSQTVNGSVSGITAGVTYHYRVKAQNAGGTTYSEDSIFEALATPPGSPTVTTLAPTMVDRFQATLNGIVNANGSDATVDFEVGATTHYNDTVSVFSANQSGTTDTAFSGAWNHHSPGTTYHYRARALGPGGYVYGPDVTFTTPAIGFPAATTVAASGITQTTALLNAYASANNGPSTTVSFEYGLDTNYGSVVTAPGYAQANSYGSKQAEIPVSGESVTYHYRVRATNNIGTTSGQDMTFTTPDPHEAKLYGLTFSSGTLSPVFNRDVLTYTMSLPFEIASLTLTPTTSTGIASVLINDVTINSGDTTSPVALNFGSNVFTIVVTALDGVAQQTYTVTVTRPAPVPGNLDLSLNGTGQLVTDFGATYDKATGMAVQGDGRIVVAGYSLNGTGYDFALARYNPDGTPDTTFNGGGWVATDVGGLNDLAAAVALQSNGKIVVAGSASNGSNNDFALVRYNGDGSLDASFNGGIVLTPFGANDASGASVAVQSDGKIIVAGSAFNGTDYDFAIMRYHGDIATGTPGTLDTSFNGSGKVVTPMGTGDDFITGVALQSNGKIVVAGYSNNGGNLDGALARYEANGTLDTTFNGSGMVSTSLSTGDDRFNAVAVQADGGIVAAGYASTGSNNDFAVARYTSSGSLDPLFNGNGKVITPVDTGDDMISGLALQSDGKIVVAGTSSKMGGELTCAVLRYEPDGNLDTTFKGSGKTTVDLGYGDDQVGGVALQGDGKIVVAGSAGLSSDFAVARILGDGPGIAVEAGAGIAVYDNLSSVDFGGALPGSSTSVTFTIRNTGTSSLTGLGLNFDGADGADFSLTTNPSAPLSPGGVTSFTARFLPSSAGLKSAALHLASNVIGNTQSFDLQLTGTGLTASENWRLQHFGTTASLGDADDLADPNGNGINNLLEYVLGGDPVGSGTGTGVLPRFPGGGDRLRMTFVRRLDRDDVTLLVQASDTPGGGWTDLAQSVNGGAFTQIAAGATIDETGSGGARSVTVGDLYPFADPAHPQRFMRLQVTRP